MRVYVAGPMRGVLHFNFPAFDAARDLGRSLGFDVVSPADIDRDNGVDEYAPPSDGFTNADLRVFVKRDVDAILTCDAIAMLPGWKQSKGARAEHAVAEWLGLTILDALTFEPLTCSSD